MTRLADLIRALVGRTTAPAIEEVDTVSASPDHLSTLQRQLEEAVAELGPAVAADDAVHVAAVEDRIAHMENAIEAEQRVQAAAAAARQANEERLRRREAAATPIREAQKRAEDTTRWYASAASVLDARADVLAARAALRGAERAYLECANASGLERLTQRLGGGSPDGRFGGFLEQEADPLPSGPPARGAAAAGSWG